MAKRTSSITKRDQLSIRKYTFSTMIRTLNVLSDRATSPKAGSSPIVKRLFTSMRGFRFFENRLSLELYANRQSTQLQLGSFRPKYGIGNSFLLRERPVNSKAMATSNTRFVGAALARSLQSMPLSPRLPTVAIPFGCLLIVVGETLAQMSTKILRLYHSRHVQPQTGL